MAKPKPGTRATPATRKPAPTDKAAEALTDSFDKLSRSIGEACDRLGESVERASEALERLSAVPAAVPPAQAAGGLPAAATPADRLTYHIRRYLPLYALATAWVLMLVLVPSVDRRDQGGGFASGGSAGFDSGPLGTGFPTGSESAADTIAVAGTGAVRSGGAAGGGATPGRVAGPPASQALGEVKAAAGTTIGGFDCKPDVRQIPWSFYAPQCVAKFEGNNGGDTFRGVTKDKIKVVRRIVPSAVAAANAAQAEAYRAQFGQPPPDVQEQVMQEFVKYFNKTFDLYGRQVELEVFESNSESTQEALGGNREQACADATHIANNIKAFMVYSGASTPFASCAVKHHLVMPLGPQYMPETTIRKLGWHPYVWQISADCDRMGALMAEYMGKRLGGRNAKYAGQQSLRISERHMGWYVPDAEEYAECVDWFTKQYAGYCHDPGVVQKYSLDPSRWPDQGTRAAVAFKAAGVTSIVLGTAPIIALFLQQGAKQQNYWPEYLIFGVAGSDVDSQVQGMDYDQSKGSMFGMSELAPTEQLLGPDGEANKTYKAATGEDLPENALGFYYELLHVFTMLQLAGPNLTPYTLHDALHRMPPTGKGGAHGLWSFQAPHPRTGDADHTAHDDVREVWWDADSPSPANGRNGTFKELNGGRRFLPGEWPTHEPDFPVVADNRV